MPPTSSAMVSKESQVPSLMRAAFCQKYKQASRTFQDSPGTTEEGTVLRLGVGAGTSKLRSQGSVAGASQGGWKGLPPGRYSA